MLHRHGIGGYIMTKISMAQAAKIFAVSRPSLAKHLKSGKISGEKVGENWQLDEAELARVYAYRANKDAGKGHADLSADDRKAATDLQAEIRVLQAKLEAEQEARKLVERNLDDLRKLLPAPSQDQGSRRRWWPFGR